MCRRATRVARYVSRKLGAPASGWHVRKDSRTCSYKRQFQKRFPGRSFVNIRDFPILRPPLNASNAEPSIGVSNVEFTQLSGILMDKKQFPFFCEIFSCYVPNVKRFERTFSNVRTLKIPLLCSQFRQDSNVRFQMLRFRSFIRNVKTRNVLLLCSQK